MATFCFQIQMGWFRAARAAEKERWVDLYLCVTMSHLADIEIGGAGNKEEESMDAKEDGREGRGSLRAGGWGEEDGGGGEEEE